MIHFIIGKKVEHSFAKIQQKTQVAMQVHVRQLHVCCGGRTAMYCMFANKETVLPLTALSTEQEQKLNAPSLN